MTSLTRRWLILLSVIAFVLVVDQVTKRVVLADVPLGESVRLVPALYPYFQITRSENNGAAFGFLPQAGDLFLIIALVVVVIMLIFFSRIPEKDRLTRMGMGLVVGGALGNALDRLSHGAVIDFIHYQIPGIVSNVSNLADHAIVIGVLLIVVESWRSDSAKVDEPEARDESGA